MTHIPNIFILREPDPDLMPKYQDNEFIYLSIDKCRENFCNELQNEYMFSESEIKISTVKNKIINDFLMDYSFITFLCGNDFVVAPQFLKVKEGGIDILMNIYRELYSELN
jgi:5'-3' exonuclease